MTADATQGTKNNGLGESSAFSISIRAWLALMITATICTLVIAGKPIDANFTAQFGMILAFYFAQGGKPKGQQ